MNLAAAFSPPKLDVPPMFQHQVESVQFYRDNPGVFNTSDPGTGKTRAYLEWFREHREEGGGKGLVLCPKSIMRAAWLNDAARWTPELRVSIATAENRREGLHADADLVIVNHDAVRSMVKDPTLLPKGFDSFNIDESGAYKSPTSMRSKAARKLLDRFEFRTAMNGTPAPNGPLDLFFQMLLVDKGERLGENFYAFRARTCSPEKVAPHLPHINWMPKPGIMEALADLIEDVTIRYALTDVIDMPDRVVQTLNFVPSAKHLKAYEELRKYQLTVTDTGETVNAIHAAALRTKLLQCMSGAAYNEDHDVITFDSARYELIGDLVEARAATLVGFQYRHTRDALVAEFKKRKIKYGVIDGSVPSMDERTEIVRRFEHGDLQVVLAHPQSAGHGLTLVRASTVIWASPTDRSDLWTQFNARIFRAGQKKRTEVIRICAAGTVEEKAYDQLTRKVSNEEALLELLT
jgi:SNF2 family DNA or RNA helicase